LDVVARNSKENIQMKRIIIPFTLFVVIIVMALGFGCTDASRARFGSYGEGSKVTLYSDNGSVIKEWTSTGRVGWRRNGFYFVDKSSNKYVMVTGTVAVESVNPR
jgi:hypothetical protein